MENFTIHIFGYGETQINSKDLSIKVATSSLTKANPLIDGIFALKPEDNNLESNQFHVIHVFGHENIRVGSSVKDVKGFNLNNEETVKVLIDELITELQVAFDSQTVEA